MSSTLCIIHYFTIYFPFCFVYILQYFTIFPCCFMYILHYFTIFPCCYMYILYYFTIFPCCYMYVLYYFTIIPSCLMNKLHYFTNTSCLMYIYIYFTIFPPCFICIFFSLILNHLTIFSNFHLLNIHCITLLHNLIKKSHHYIQIMYSVFSKMLYSDTLYFLQYSNFQFIISFQILFHFSMI
jgi:hypothetical protein